MPNIPLYLSVNMPSYTSGRWYESVIHKASTRDGPQLSPALLRTNAATVTII